MPRMLLKQGINDVVRISDARMSGTSFGTVVLHVAPESAVGGPLSLVQTGDEIELDVPARTLKLNISAAEWAARDRSSSCRRRRTTRAATDDCFWSTSRRRTRAAISISLRGLRLSGANGMTDSSDAPILPIEEPDQRSSQRQKGIQIGRLRDEAISRRGFRWSSGREANPRKSEQPLEHRRSPASPGYSAARRCHRFSADSDPERPDRGCVRSEYRPRRWT